MTLAGRISAALTEAALAPREDGLRGFLQGFVNHVVRLPGILGSLVAALDEEVIPLAVGEHQLLAGHDFALAETSALVRDAICKTNHGAAWAETQTTGLALGDRQLSLVIRASSRRLGLIVVRISKAGRVPTRTLNALRDNAPLLALALKSSIAQEVGKRVEQLHDLARETLQQNPLDFQPMVERLSKLFDAGVVTLLLNEQEELHLSASTNSRIGTLGQIVYKRGEGLSGHIFQSGRALRLSNTEDQQEVFRLTGLSRTGPRLSDWNHEGDPPVQFLGVPMHYGGQIAGIIRMSREEGRAQFTIEDQRALQFFADILGTAVAPRLKILLAESMLESVAEGIAVSRWERSPEGRPMSRIIMANPGAETLLERDRHAIEGLDAREIYGPGEYERLRQVLRPAVDIARREGHAEYGPILSRMKRADQTMAPVTISYRLLTNRLVQPPTLYIIGLARETSQVELMAEQHKRLLELLGAMRIAYFRADQAGITQASTSTDCDISGYSPEELSVMPRTHLYADPTTPDQLLQRARENQGHLSRVLVQMRRKNGERFWSEGDLRILKDPMNREIGSEGLYRDVTDRIRLQGFINLETDRVLSDSELFKGLEKDAEFQLDYLSSLSHQLQTPLGSLLETLRNFERGEISQKLLQLRLPYVIGQTVVCTRLVRNLSYMDKILRREPFEKGRVSLVKLAIQTKLDFVHLLEERGLDIRIDDESIERHVLVQGHQEMLRQVLVNLVDNAIKYSLPHTSITIRGRRWPEGNALEISNEGLPLPAEDRERIFQRGFRTLAAQAAVPHGTGLGLWVVRRTLEAHGATIRCLEVLEGGKKRVLFRILFPHPASGPRRGS